jgi:hypothetical protein
MKSPFFPVQPRKAKMLASVKKGAGLVKAGGAGKTFQCATCHGAD